MLRRYHYGLISICSTVQCFWGFDGIKALQKNDKNMVIPYGKCGKSQIATPLIWILAKCNNLSYKMILLSLILHSPDRIAVVPLISTTAKNVQQVES